MAKLDQEEIRQHREQPTGYYNLANTYFAAGKYEEAAGQTGKLSASTRATPPHTSSWASVNCA